jgi:hypothetical protein
MSLISFGLFLILLKMVWFKFEVKETVRFGLVWLKAIQA